MGVTFIEGEPPPSAYGWAGVALELKRRPGEWGVISESTFESPRKAYMAHTYLSKGRAKSMPLVDFEFRLANHKLYARYLGEGEE